MNPSETSFKQAGIIDIGAHSIRLEIYQFASGGRVEVLERMSREVNLGFDVFRQGVITPANVNLTCEIMLGFARRLREYGVTECRAVATSAVREAGNRELLLDRIFLACGIRVEILESQEEARLLYSGVKKLLVQRNEFPRGQVLCFAIGTGSLIVMFVKDGLLRFGETTALGSVRMFDELGKLEIKPERILDLLESQELKLRLIQTAGYDPAKPCSVIGIGAGVRAMLALRSIPEEDVVRLNAAEVAKVTEWAMRTAPLVLTEQYGMVDHLAVSVAPSCGIADYFLKCFQASELVVPGVTTRLALLDEMRHPASREEFEPDLIAVTKAIGAKYGFDLQHAELTAMVALKIFDKIKRRYGLDDRDRMMLEVAALLHDVGRYIDLRQHHRHSWYLIAYSQLPGLSNLELKLAALVARYHRKSAPKLTHPEFIELNAADQVRVSKMAAVLRVADALVRSDSEKYRKLEIHLSGSELSIRIEGNTDWLWETVYLAKKGDMFAEVFGLKLRFEEILSRTRK